MREGEKARISGARSPENQRMLDAALAQIDAAFGKGADTPEHRRVRAKHQLERLIPALEGARKVVEAEKVEKAAGDDCPDIPIDPFTAYAVGWFLRNEADTDEAIAVEGVTDALEEAASRIENGYVFGSAEDLLRDLEDDIRHWSYVAEHGEDPPAPPPPEPYAPDDPRLTDDLPF